MEVIASRKFSVTVTATVCVRRGATSKSATMCGYVSCLCAVHPPTMASPCAFMCECARRGATSNGFAVCLYVCVCLPLAHPPAMCPMQVLKHGSIAVAMARLHAAPCLEQFVHLRGSGTAIKMRSCLRFPLSKHFTACHVKVWHALSSHLHPPAMQWLLRACVDVMLAELNPTLGAAGSEG
eukprot:361389-Chlamydomonas_euryale.AAC.3